MRSRSRAEGVSGVFMPELLTGPAAAMLRELSFISFCVNGRSASGATVASRLGWYAFVVDEYVGIGQWVVSGIFSSLLSYSVNMLAHVGFYNFV